MSADTAANVTCRPCRGTGSRIHGWAICPGPCQDCGGTGRRAQEPTEPGWYAYSGGAQSMIFHLNGVGQWSAHFDNGTAGDCAWGYIEQALGVWDLVRIKPEAVTS